MLFSGFNHIVIRLVSTVQPRSCTESTYYNSSAPHSEGGAIHCPRNSLVYVRRQRRWTREANATWACMLNRKCAHSYCTLPTLCAPVCIYSSMSSVNLSKPFRAFTLVLSEEEKSNPPECSV